MWQLGYPIQRELVYLYNHSKAESARSFPANAQLKRDPKSFKLPSSSQTRSITSGGSFVAIFGKIQRWSQVGEASLIQKMFTR